MNIGETYFDRVGAKPASGDAALKREFDKAINAAVEEVIERLPELLAPLLDEKGAELFSQMPDCLARPDPVTRQVITEAVVRRMLAAKVGNALGRGMNFLQDK
ncbi:hypothetical protein BTJ78_001320 [Escherichia coli]|nr:hypothetical protein [Escherichia coli]EFF8893095.1 hypothetical protein [Escherichia coli]